MVFKDYLNQAFIVEAMHRKYTDDIKDPSLNIKKVCRCVIQKYLEATSSGFDVVWHTDQCCTDTYKERSGKYCPYLIPEIVGCMKKSYKNVYEWILRNEELHYPTLHLENDPSFGEVEVEPHSLEYSKELGWPKSMYQIEEPTENMHGNQTIYENSKIKLV